MAVFGNGLDLRKWTGTIADLINVRKKLEYFVYKNEFFYLNSNKK